MKVNAWLNSLKPALCDPSPTAKETLEQECRGVFNGLCCPHCTARLWTLKVELEPTYKRTHWLAVGQCANCQHEIRVFDANSLGWAYSIDELKEFTCSCGETKFSVTLIFEPYEDANDTDDVSWFWSYAECVKCQQQNSVTNWELD
jgi:hypothetical protein